jgi:Ankyrin repeats (3 copies)
MEQQQQMEQQRMEQQRREQQRMEQQRMEQQRMEQQRMEQQRMEQQRMEQQRMEQQRMEQQRMEQQRMEQQRMEQQRMEQHRMEQQRLQEQMQQRNQQQLMTEQHKAEDRKSQPSQCQAIGPDGQCLALNNQDLVENHFDVGSVGQHDDDSGTSTEVTQDRTSEGIISDGGAQEDRRSVDSNGNDEKISSVDLRKIVVVPNQVQVLRSYLKTLQQRNDAKKIINEQDENGWTALHYAVDMGIYEYVKLLVEHGASMNRLTYSSKFTPLEIAYSKYTRDHDITQILEEYEDMNHDDEL